MQHRLNASKTPRSQDQLIPAQELCGDGLNEEGVAAHLKCDLWALGMITVSLLGGRTAFSSHMYSALVRGSHQAGKLRSNGCQQVFAPSSRGSKAILTHALHAVQTMFSHISSWIGGLSRVGTRTSCPRSSADDAEDVEVRGCASCMKGTALHTQVQALVDQQLDELQQCGRSTDVLALLRGLLEPDPRCRFSAPQALAHAALRMFVRADAAAASSGSAQTVNPRLAATVLARQLWGVVRQSRQQLVEMARRETLVATLAERRDALEQLATVVASTLSGDSPHTALDTIATQTSKQGAYGGSGSAGHGATGMLHQACDTLQQARKVNHWIGCGRYDSALFTGSLAKASIGIKAGGTVLEDLSCSSPKQGAPVNQQQRYIGEQSRSGKVRRCIMTSSSARKLSGRVRFSGAGDAMNLLGYLPAQPTVAYGSSVPEGAMPGPIPARLHSQNGGMSVLVNVDRLG